MKPVLNRLPFHRHWRWGSIILIVCLVVAEVVGRWPSSLQTISVPTHVGRLGIGVGCLETETRNHVGPVVSLVRWNITILIHTSKNTFETRALAIKRTWLSKPLPTGVRYFWVTDEILADDAYILINNRPRPGLREEPVGAMNERVIQSFMQVLEKEASLWYLKVDDDTYVNVPAITMEALAGFLSPNSIPHYAGLCWETFGGGIRMCELLEHFDCSVFEPTGKELQEEIETGRSYIRYSGGGVGYFLSQAAVKELVRYEKDVGAKRGFEDMMVGDVMMRQLGVPCLSISSSFFQMVSLEGHFNNHFEQLLESLNSSNAPLGTAHKIMPDAMYDVHQRIG